MSKALTMTAKRIERLVSAKQGQLGHHRDAEVRGLYLQIVRLESKDRPAAASWILRFQLHGREHQLGLGSLHDVPLEEARRRARAAREKLSLGVNPLAEKREAQHKAKLERARAVTFEAATVRFHEERKDKEAAATSDQFISSMRRHAFPTLGTIPVGQIDRQQVLQTLTPIWNARRETAQRIRSGIERVLDWAESQGLREGANVARWAGLKMPLSALATKVTVKNHAALPFAQLPAFIQELRKRQGSAARALEFLILTACRTSEVLGARWDEIDLDGKLWTIPADRMKADKPHTVPLSDQAVTLLRELPREDAVVFVGMKKGQGLSNMSMSNLLQKRLKVDATVHGFRSTFKDWASECTAYPNEVSEMALAHSISSSVEKAYRRGPLLEKRKRLMADWANYCDGKAILTDATVVPLRAPA
jgi:integrase